MSINLQPDNDWGAILAWNDWTVYRLAEQMYESKCCVNMPILGDALEEAGYLPPHDKKLEEDSNFNVMIHCRLGLCEKNTVCDLVHSIYGLKHGDIEIIFFTDMLIWAAHQVGRTGLIPQLKNDVSANYEIRGVLQMKSSIGRLFKGIR